MIRDRHNEDVLISILTHTYEQVFVLDAGARAGVLIQNGKQSDIADFNQWWKECCEKSYVGDDQAVFVSKMNLETVIQVLEEKEEYIVEYSVRNETGEIRMQAKAFWLDEKKTVGVCISDITEQYEDVLGNKRLLEEALSIAQNSSVERYRLWKEMEAETKVPVEQACEILEISTESDGSLKPEEVDKLKRLLDMYKHNLGQWFTYSLMEKGENLENAKVIFPDEFLADLERMLDAGKKDASVTYELENKCPQVFSFVSDGIWLKQMVCESMGVVAECSTKKAVKASLAFEIAEPTEEQEPVFDFAFKICADYEGKETDLNKKMQNARYLAEYLNGNVYVTAREKQVEVLFRIPVKRPTLEEEKAAGVMAHMINNVQEDGFERFRALVVDDDDINREIISIKLKMLGLAVEEAADGEKLIEKLIGSPIGYYNVVFMKMILPKKTGLDATMEIREMKRNDLNDITIIAYTSNALRDKRIRALEHGMDYHLVQPFDDIQLKEILVRELEGLGPKDEHTKFGFRVLK